MNPPADPIDDATRRRNNLLGLALGGLVVAVIVAFMIAFSLKGLPKDPKVWKQMHDEQQQRNDQP
jgi:hypothetical protein